MIIKMSEARPHSFLVVDRGPWSCYNILAQAGEAIGTYNFALQNVTFRKVRTPSRTIMVRDKLFRVIPGRSNPRGANSDDAMQGAWSETAKSL